MLEEKGIVISIGPGLAWVQTQIKTTCGSCKAKDNCGTSTIAKAFSPKPNVISIVTDVKLTVGDSVTIGIEEDFVVLSSFYVYIFPIIGFMLLALLSEQLIALDILAVSEIVGELITVVVAFFGGWLGYLVASKKLNLLACQSNAKVRLLAIDSQGIDVTNVDS